MAPTRPPGPATSERPRRSVSTPMSSTTRPRTTTPLVSGAASPNSELNACHHQEPDHQAASSYVPSNDALDPRNPRKSTSPKQARPPQSAPNAENRSTHNDHHGGMTRGFGFGLGGRTSA